MRKKSINPQGKEVYACENESLVLTIENLASSILRMRFLKTFSCAVLSLVPNGIIHHLLVSLFSISSHLNMRLDFHS